MYHTVSYLYMAYLFWMTYFLFIQIGIWWRHQIETFSALPVPGEFPSQRPVTRSFDVIFDLHLNERLRKQSWGWWYETLSRPLWRHCNGVCDVWYFVSMFVFVPQIRSFLVASIKHSGLYTLYPRVIKYERSMLSLPCDNDKVVYIYWLIGVCLLSELTRQHLSSLLTVFSWNRARRRSHVS